MISTLIYSFIASMLACLVFHIVISKKEHVVRAFLSQAKGRIKKWYIKIFIQAVRGEARISDTRTLGHLFLIFPLVLLYLSVDMYNRHDALSERSNEQIEELSRLASGEEMPETNIDEVKSEALRINNDLNRLYYWIVYLVLAANLWLLWLVIIHNPRIVYRCRFAYELERFMLRIQGLASKNELAELCDLEANVVDEPSALEYVAKMNSIARRYKVHHLVDTFLLWDDVN